MSSKAELAKVVAVAIDPLSPLAFVALHSVGFQFHADRE
jgi:hypothetical protein